MQALTAASFDVGLEAAGDEFAQFEAAVAAARAKMRAASPGTGGSGQQKPAGGAD